MEKWLAETGNQFPKWQVKARASRTNFAQNQCPTLHAIAH